MNKINLAVDKQLPDKLCWLPIPTAHTSLSPVPNSPRHGGTHPHIATCLRTGFASNGKWSDSLALWVVLVTGTVDGLSRQAALRNIVTVTVPKWGNWHRKLEQASPV